MRSGRLIGPPQGEYIYAPEPKRSWSLIPSARVRQFPDYIPDALLADYREACEIRDLSPKASATLSRRVLQGMIRHFFGISRNTLYEEIDALKGGNPLVPPNLWNAIDGLRKLGNIGAHMQRDINIIVEVDSDEAEKLIKLVEILFEAWYVARHDLDEHLKEVTELAAAKEAAKVATSAPTASATPAPSGTSPTS
jgi:hypothetical protein